ncbi:MAG: FMN-binding glutamate synthase family protein, partial [Gammaproteobacteria bacterium]|nr:FMN-binding glutamate synthase family protein [Gammaproteobacteria bacterium]
MQKTYWLIASLGNISTVYLYSQTTSVISILLLIITGAYTVIGFYDIYFCRHNLNRLYPVVAYIRYFLESYRVEIQQYFIANDTEE